MIKIEKSKYIRMCLTFLTAIALIFSTLLIYFLGWEFKWRTFGICMGIILLELVLLLVLCIVLIKINKSCYFITNDAIKLLKNKQEILCIQSRNIVKIDYIGFGWIFLMQMGAGYLHIEYTEVTGELNQTTLFPRRKIYSISMSKKQAQQVSILLNKDLKIK